MQDSSFSLSSQGPGRENPGLNSPFSLNSVRALARENSGLEELAFCEEAEVVVFRRTGTDNVVSVYYGDVCSIMVSSDHAGLASLLGKTESFHRNVTASLLQQIFGTLSSNLHTSSVYSILPPASPLSPSTLTDQETMLRSHLNHLHAQTEAATVALHLVLVYNQRKKEEAVLEEQAKKERQALEQVRAEEEASRLTQQSIQLRRRLRGLTCEHSLTFSEGFPATLDDVAHIAISSGGVLFVTDWGGHGYHGVSIRVREAVDRQLPKNLAYVALGPNEQYFLKKKTGGYEWHSCEEFTATMEKVIDSRVDVELVSFGPLGTWYFQCVDGSAYWAGQHLDLKLVSIIQARHIVKIESLWIGQNGAFFVVLSNGKVSFKHLPPFVARVVTKSNAGRVVTQLLVDEDSETWLIRYSPSV